MTRLPPPVPRHLLLACSVLVPVIAAGAARAQGAPSDPRLAALARLEGQAASLQAQTDALRAEIAALRASMGVPDGAVAAVPLPASRSGPAAPAAPAPDSPDGEEAPTRLTVRGQFQLDATGYRQDRPAGPDLRRADSASAADLNSGTNLRRARLGVEGQLDSAWRYGVVAEFGGTGVESPILNAAFIEHGGWRPVAGGPELRVRIGAWAPPTGLEDATSSTDALFIERAAAADLVRGLAGADGRSGIGVTAVGRRWTAAATLTGGTVGGSGEFDEQTGYITRLAVLAHQGSGSGLVLGLTATGLLDVADTDPSVASRQTIRLRERPESRVDGTRLVDTGAIAADGLRTIGLEAGGWAGRLYWAGELFRIDVDRSGSGADPQFGGWYLQGAWTLTGETRRWNPGTGGIGGIRPRTPFDPAAGSWGALEIAARHSVIDLDSDPGAPGSAAVAGVTVRGGVQTVTSLGLNWYPGDAIRISAVQQWIGIDRLDPENGEVAGTGLFGGLPSVPGNGAQIGQDIRAFTIRTQLTF